MLGEEQVALGVEHFDVGGGTLTIAQPREARDLACRGQAASPRRELFGIILPPGERIGDLAERPQDGNLVAVDGDILARAGEGQITAVAAAIEDRTRDSTTLWSTFRRSATLNW